MADSNENTSDNFGNLTVENGGAGLDGDAAGAATGADLSDDTSGEAETDALDEEDADVAAKSTGAGIADETAGYDQAMQRNGVGNPQDSEDVADSVTGNG